MKKLMVLALFLCGCAGSKPTPIDRTFASGQKHVVDLYCFSKQHNGPFWNPFYDSAFSQMSDSIYIFITNDLHRMRPIDSAHTEGENVKGYYSDKQALLDGKFNTIIAGRR